MYTSGVVGSFSLKATIVDDALQTTFLMFEIRLFTLGNSFLICSANLFRPCQSMSHILNVDKIPLEVVM
jgi:hypothetical protein